MSTLVRLPLTELDASIWHGVVCKWPGTTGFDYLWTHSLQADPLDAKRMLNLTRFKKDCTPRKG